MLASDNLTTEGAIVNNVKQVVRVTSDSLEVCNVCGLLPGPMGKEIDVAHSINHYLKHGYKLLHIGQETSKEDDGLWQSTVAVLGKE
jgi:hypothetical protein